MCPLGIILSTYCCNLSVVLTLQLSLLHLHFPLLRNRVKSVFLLKLEFPVKLLKLSHSLVSWPAGISTHPELDQEGMLTKFTAHLHYLEVKHKHALSTVAMLTGNNICDMCQRSHCHKPEQHDSDSQAKIFIWPVTESASGMMQLKKNTQKGLFLPPNTGHLCGCLAKVHSLAAPDSHCREVGFKTCSQMPSVVVIQATQSPICIGVLGDFSFSYCVSFPGRRMVLIQQLFYGMLQ